jgi:ATP phosphoribosyltransferase regulatory subunit HisZ
VGFGLCIEELQQLLQSRDRLPTSIAATDWLVVPRDTAAQAAAHTHARTLRRENPSDRVEVALEEIAASPTTVRDYAFRRRVQQLVWVAADGAIEVEALV